MTEQDELAERAELNPTHTRVLALVSLGLLCGCAVLPALADVVVSKPMSGISLRLIAEEPGHVEIAWAASYGEAEAPWMPVIGSVVGISEAWGSFSMPTGGLAADCTEHPVFTGEGQLSLGGMPRGGMRHSPDDRGVAGAFLRRARRESTDPTCSILLLTEEYLLPPYLPYPNARRLVVVRGVSLADEELGGVLMPFEHTVFNPYKWRDVALSPLVLAGTIVYLPVLFVALAIHSGAP